MIERLSGVNLPGRKIQLPRAMRTRAATAQLLTPFLVIILVFFSPARLPGILVQTEHTSSEGKRQFQREIENKLHDLDQEISELKAKAPANSDGIRKQFDRQIADLDHKRKVAQQRFEKFKNSSQQAWRDLIPGVDAAVKDLEAATQRAASDFKRPK